MIFLVGPVLQIKKGNRHNLEISTCSHISPLNIFCDPSLEQSRWASSNEGSQLMFLMRNKKKLSLNYLQYPFLSGVLISAPDNYFRCPNFGFICNNLDAAFLVLLSA